MNFPFWTSTLHPACTLSRSVMSNSVTLHTAACQPPLSMGFPRQEYWSGLPFPSPGDLPDPGIENASPVSPALAGRFFVCWPTWEANLRTTTRRISRRMELELTVYKDIYRENDVSKLNSELKKTIFFHNLHFYIHEISGFNIEHYHLTSF